MIFITNTYLIIQLKFGKVVQMLAQAEYNESIDRYYQAASLYYNVSIHEEGLQNFINSMKNILLDKAGPKK